MFAITARVSCSVVFKLAVAAGGTGGQVIAGLTAPVLQFAESYPSITAYSYDGHFLIIIPIGFRFSPDLIRCRSTFKFKPIIIYFLSRSSNVGAEDIGRRDVGTI